MKEILEALLIVEEAKYKSYKEAFEAYPFSSALTEASEAAIIDLRDKINSIKKP